MKSTNQQIIEVLILVRDEIEKNKWGFCCNECQDAAWKNRYDKRIFYACKEIILSHRHIADNIKPTNSSVFWDKYDYKPRIKFLNQLIEIVKNQPQ